MIRSSLSHVTSAVAARHEADDAELVQRSLQNGPDDFSAVVSRYQTLVCSLTYSATGSISRSQDLAQEVFVTAWKELRSLREPAKLRAWLCGIARRLIANTVRRERREPVCAADELGEEHQAAAPGPVEHLMSREEEAILWRSLEQIPETYREPLVLFYREGQSVERVAQALELSEDAARQRLSRGRALLKEQVAAFVEGALRLSTPGRAFTAGVLVALPLMKTTATATTIAAAAAAKTGAGAAGAGAAWLALASALVGPFIGCLGAWFGVKASLDAAGSERERALIRRHTRLIIVLVTVFVGAMALAAFYETGLWRGHPALAIGLGAGLGAGLPLLYVIALVTTILRFRREQCRLRAQDASTETPESVARRAAAWKTFEYKSPWTFLGLPLVHIRTGRPMEEKLRPAIGWIAIGDVAIGVLFSLGGFAFGGISLGGFSLGVFAVGGAAFGVLSLGGVAMGLWAATGGLAIGWLAYGGLAIGWHAAEGGFAAAREFALGGAAYAAHANDALARSTIASHRVLRHLQSPLLPAFSYLPLLLIIWQARRARRVLRGMAK